MPVRRPSSRRGRLVESYTVGRVVLVDVRGSVGVKQEVEGLRHQLAHGCATNGSQTLERGHFVRPEEASDLILVAAWRFRAQRQRNGSFSGGANTPRHPKHGL